MSWMKKATVTYLLVWLIVTVVVMGVLAIYASGGCLVEGLSKE